MYMSYHQWIGCDKNSIVSSIVCTIFPLGVYRPVEYEIFLSSALNVMGGSPGDVSEELVT